MSRRVVVVGAGPAGMHAALAAAGAGVDVLLVDAAPAVGGQFHRQPLTANEGSPSAVGAGQRFAEPAALRPRAAQRASESSGATTLRKLRARLDGQPRITYLPQTSVWAVEPGLRLHLQTGPADAPGQRMSTVDADALVIATGAYDRVLPFPGWELPGVFTAGGAQALAKGQRIAVGRRVLVAGTGPFLLPVAESLLGVGADVVGVLEANRPGSALRGFASRPGSWLAAATKTPELLRYVAALARRRVPYRTGTAVVAAHGTDALEAVTIARVDAGWRELPGTRRWIAVDALCVGHGFTPQLELALAAGCQLTAPAGSPDASSGSKPSSGGGYVAVDRWQATSMAGVFAAGEVTGIGGAVLAADEGTLAGLGAARHLGVPGLERQAAAARRRVRRGRGFAAALTAAYPIGDGWRTWLTDDTVICRCEEVPYAALAAAAGHAESVRSLKLLCRVGLGMCQGRICGTNASELADALLTAAGHAPLSDATAMIRRPLATPIRLGDLAAAPMIMGPTTQSRLHEGLHDLGENASQPPTAEEGTI